MAKTKRSVKKRKRKKKWLKAAKGYKWRRKSTYRAAKQAVMKAWSYQYRDRRRKKREFRRRWQDQINQAVRQHGLSYSKFIHLLKQNNIKLNRKMLAQLSDQYPKTFKNIAQKVQEKK